MHLHFVNPAISRAASEDASCRWFRRVPFSLSHTHTTYKVQLTASCQDPKAANASFCIQKIRTDSYRDQCISVLVVFLDAIVLSSDTAVVEVLRSTEQSSVRSLLTSTWARRVFRGREQQGGRCGGAWGVRREHARHNACGLQMPIH